MDDVKNTNALAVRHVEKKCELLEIRQAILKSSKQVAVVFIDLVGSTNLKQKSDDETWLISIYEFIGLIAGLARETRGTLVERLGDGALITFEDVLSATTFIDAVARDSKMGAVSYTHLDVYKRQGGVLNLDARPGGNVGEMTAAVIVIQERKCAGEIARRPVRATHIGKFVTMFAVNLGRPLHIIANKQIKLADVYKRQVNSSGKADSDRFGLGNLS